MTDAPDADLRKPWGTHPLPDGGGVLTVRVGPLSLWARGREDEVWLAHAPGDWARRRREEDREPPPEDEEWVRWPVGGSARRVRLSPVFPSRPLVVKPELSFRLVPGTEARIYVRPPLWAAVTVPGDEDRQLTEVPTVELSDTWWGEFDAGELGYWLPTGARRTPPGPEGFEPHQAVCPVDLANRSDDVLEVEKIALRVGHLSIYRGEGGLWANSTRVRYRGSDEASEVDVAGRAPEEAGRDAVRVAAPREPVTRGFRARTFSRLRVLSGLGGTE